VAARGGCDALLSCFSYTVSETNTEM
jgi:hypothetical protein